VLVDIVFTVFLYIWLWFLDLFLVLVIEFGEFHSFLVFMMISGSFFLSLLCF